ncbi:hypothetical protein K0G90_14735 [Bacteroides thetaiotaomicron]|jgi:hypothetical protein|uniref:DUF1566 domain-containing protein n=1 Tax=Bacteroides thetaiotaomicron TaxID=818 RepID=A0AAW4ZAE8_BACT4|nr:hypothetical protein [Bacteroides thetaiotaomicron]MCE9238051.1 hypothetical protein [Bacteroides thetaiotaomicron]MCE9267721.1 hypothetical protein [Bacteroides thetaiotaomicron]MCE9277016.1 hypothetical protein [Bacteroides thetaiotaomicron]MCE9290902.1 hypothetical protein [Bacteroides thetaiotaomicron]
MRLKRFLLPILAWSGLMLTSCHCEHEEVTGYLSSLQVGNVVCSDGNILPMDRFKQSEKVPVAIVFHVNRSPDADNFGYAVYIHDMELLAFADSLGIDQGTSASLTDEDGNENTYSLFNNDEVQSPMAVRTFDLWSYGQSAYIPSVRQLSYLFAVRYQINECITEVDGTPINLNPGECWLWSSTEVEGQKENKAWLYSMQSGIIQETPKDQKHKFRPIISLYKTQ